MITAAELKQRLPLYVQLARLDRPIGFFLLLWPTYWALWLAAEGLPSIKNLVIFTLGVILTRAGGCIINDYADRDFDGHVSRTQNRPLAQKKIEPKEALVLAALFALLAFILVLFTNLLTIQLSFVAAGLAFIYPFMKRYTHLPQLFLGAAFSMAIPMAFAAETNSVPKIVWLIYCANLIWTVAYDTMYAMVDREDDLKVGIKSTAVLFGDADKLIVGTLQGLMLLALMMVGSQANLGWPYYLGLVGATGFFGYQQWLIKDREEPLCFKAFLNNNWAGLCIFLGIAGHFALA